VIIGIDEQDRADRSPDIRSVSGDASRLEPPPEPTSPTRRAMATYISLIRFTQQGISSIKDAPARLDAGKETLKSFGSELKAFYLTMGRYDIVTISDAPDDAAAAKVALAVGSAGNVTTETLRAFTEDEYREIVAALP
jgi:uncharacterized protein with GYD domain